MGDRALKCIVRMYVRSDLVMNQFSSLVTPELGFRSNSSLSWWCCTTVCDFLSLVVNVGIHNYPWRSHLSQHCSTWVHLMNFQFRRVIMTWTGTFFDLFHNVFMKYIFTLWTWATSSDISECHLPTIKSIEGDFFIGLWEVWVPWLIRKWRRLFSVFLVYFVFFMFGIVKMPLSGGLSFAAVAFLILLTFFAIFFFRLVLLLFRFSSAYDLFLFRILLIFGLLTIRWQSTSSTLISLLMCPLLPSMVSPLRLLLSFSRCSRCVNEDFICSLWIFLVRMRALALSCIPLPPWTHNQLNHFWWV